jgi:hypothetical protein
MYDRCLRLMLLFALTAVGTLANALPAGAQDVPPLATSSNLQLLGHVPGSAAGMNFKGKYAYVSGWAGITVLTSPRRRRRSWSGRSHCRTSRTRTRVTTATDAG